MSFWNDTNRAVVKRMCEEGYSAGQIAAAVGATRNAVMGVIHRNGWDRAPNAQHKTLPSPPRAKRRAPKVVLNKIENHFGSIEKTIPKIIPSDGLTDLPPDQSPYAVSLFDAEPHHCRYPLTDAGPGFLFCGDTKIPNSSYCERHDRLCIRIVPRISRSEFEAHNRARKHAHAKSLEQGLFAEAAE
jgi:hypothetical protein